MILKSVRDNKAKSFFIVSLFVLFVSLAIYYVCSYLNFGILSIPFAIAFSSITALISYYSCDKIVLSINGARRADAKEFNLLNSQVESLCIASGMQKPKMYVIDSPSLNAFATGRNPQNSVICVTTGLLNKLDSYELQGVLAHELAHIKNYDILLSTVVSVFVGFLVILSDIFTRSFFFRSSRDKDNESSGNGNIIFFLIGLIFIILAPIAGTLMQLALSRRREYLADSTSVEFTRNPEGLISALKKLDIDNIPMENANKATANLYIVNPFKGINVSNLFSTHPPITDRIDALKKIN